MHSKVAVCTEQLFVLLATTVDCLTAAFSAAQVSQGLDDLKLDQRQFGLRINFFRSWIHTVFYV